MKIKFIIKEFTNHAYFAKWKKFFDDTLKTYQNGWDIYKAWQILQDNGFVPLGRGSFRKVFGFPDNAPYVLKIVENSRNNIMNKREADPHIQTRYASILPKMYIRADDYSWIVTEKVRPSTSNDIIKEIPGILHVGEFINLLSFAKHNVIAKQMNIKKAIQVAVKEILEDRYEKGGHIKSVSPAINKIIDFSIEYNIAVWDLWEKNLGVTEDGNLVILDSSFQEDISRM